METLRITNEKNTEYRPFSEGRKLLRNLWNNQFSHIDWELFLLSAEVAIKAEIYDNGGETYDRITIVLKGTKDENGLHDCIGSSETGIGYFSHGKCMNGAHLGKQVLLHDLNPELQLKIKEYFEF